MEHPPPPPPVSEAGAAEPTLAARGDQVQPALPPGMLVPMQLVCRAFGSLQGPWCLLGREAALLDRLELFLPRKERGGMGVARFVPASRRTVTSPWPFVSPVSPLLAEVQMPVPGLSASPTLHHSLYHALRVSSLPVPALG